MTLLWPWSFGNRVFFFLRGAGKRPSRLPGVLFKGTFDGRRKAVVICDEEVTSERTFPRAAGASYFFLQEIIAEKGETSCIDIFEFKKRKKSTLKEQSHL